MKKFESLRKQHKVLRSIELLEGNNKKKIFALFLTKSGKYLLYINYPWSGKNLTTTYKSYSIALECFQMLYKTYRSLP